jgi:hypothetical protein
MIQSGFTPRLRTIGAKMQSLARFKWLFSLVIAVAVTVAATPPPDQTLPDEQYIQIMTIIDRADALRVAGHADAAKVKYFEAQKQLLYFKAINPLFAPKTVQYRINELNARLETRPVLTTTNSPAGSKTALEAPAPAPKSNIKVTDAGAEPRKALRFHIAPADKQSVIMTLKVNIDPATAAALGAAAAQNPSPAITVPWDVTIQNVATNGDVSYEAVIGEVNVVSDTNTPPAAALAAKTVFAALKGTITGVISSSGVSKKVEGKAPPGLDLQLRQIYDTIKEAISNPSVPLPDEAIGVGAKWEVKIPNKSQGASMDQTAAFELVSVDGDHVKATVSATVGANAKTPGPTIATTGTVDADLSKLVASETVANIHFESPPNKQMPGGAKMDINETVVAK